MTYFEWNFANLKILVWSQDNSAEICDCPQKLFMPFWYVQKYCLQASLERGSNDNISKFIFALREYLIGFNSVYNNFSYHGGQFTFSCLLSISPQYSSQQSFQTTGCFSPLVEDEWRLSQRHVKHRKECCLSWGVRTHNPRRCWWSYWGLALFALQVLIYFSNFQSFRSWLIFL